MGLTRTEFWGRLGLIQVVKPLTNYAYDLVEESMWRSDEGNSPHGEHWHTSFHASSFPGDDPLACPRKALYTLMNIPPKEPTPRRLRQYGDMGSDHEHQLVKRWAQVGALISNRSDEGEIQTGFIDPAAWLTGNCDAITIPQGWNRGHVVEIKGKRLKFMEQLRSMREQPVPKHVKQVKTYIGEAHEMFHLRFPFIPICGSTWAIAEPADDLEEQQPITEWTECPIHGYPGKCLEIIEMHPVVDGTLFYYAWDDPDFTCEFLYGLDPKFMEQGKETLKLWKQNFLNGELPQRPDDWMWATDPYPCKNCDFKGDTKGHDVCKADDREGITKLEDSHAIETAKKIRPNYDYDQTRQAVLDRWEKEVRE